MPRRIMSDVAYWCGPSNNSNSGQIAKLKEGNAIIAMASAGARAYNNGLGAEPPAGSRGRAPSQGIGSEASLKLKTILLLDTRQTCRACRFFSISQRSVWFSFWVMWNLPSELEEARRSPSKNGRGTGNAVPPRSSWIWPIVYYLRHVCDDDDDDDTLCQTGFYRDGWSCTYVADSGLDE